MVVTGNEATDHHQNNAAKGILVLENHPMTDDECVDAVDDHSPAHQEHKPSYHEGLLV